MHPLRTLWTHRNEAASATAVALALLLALLAGIAEPTQADTITAQPWSDPATWGGQVPADGASVTIPAGTVVMLDRDVSLANLTIDGTLEFARRDLVLESDWIMVHGVLQVGTVEAPFEQQATIRLRDRTPNENMGHLGDKFVGLMGGRLELHGQPRRSWTRLVRTARAGQRQLVLATASGWHAGDRIAIASTDFDSGQHEQFTIRSVNGRTVTLDKALRYTHFGVRQKIAGRWLDERAEVALLSRNVRVEGDADSERSKLGGQIMAMDRSVLHIENTELTRMGQEGILLRYPIHFHMLDDDAAGSYVRQSSIHHTYNRCLTIHGSNGVQVSGNACYDHIGHGYFLEDGAEQRNSLTGNLGFATRKPDKGKQILDSDRSPATFWITNPNNSVRSNVAAGSQGHGFWIALPEHPTGLFAKRRPDEAAGMWPRRMRLRSFVGNTAHSNDRDGLHFDNGPNPDSTTSATWHEAHVDPADEKSRAIVTTIRGLVAYKNRNHGVWLRGRGHRVVNATLADNAIGATFASDESFLQRSFVVGESANVGTPQRWERERGEVGRRGRSLPQPWEADYPVRGFEFYDGRVGVEQTLFANFQPYRSRSGKLRQQSAIGYHVDNDFGIHAKNFASKVRFVNAKRVYLELPQIGHDGDVSAVFLDADGSVTGRRGRSLMTRNRFLYGSACRLRRDFNAQECSGDYASLIVSAPDDRKAMKPVRIRRDDGAMQTLTASGGGDAMTSILANSTYRVSFNGGTPKKSRYVLRNGRDRWARIAIPHGPSFRVMRYGCNVAEGRSWCYGKHATMASLDASDRSGYYHDAAARTLYLRLVSDGSDWDELVVE